jgi:hypothetical protein
MRFFPESRFGRHTQAPNPRPSTLPPPTDISEKIAFTKVEHPESEPEYDFDLDIPDLANTFTDHVPEDEFSTAELQGYLLMYKKRPLRAVAGVDAWVEEERQARKEREEREKERKNAMKAKGQFELDKRALSSALVLNGGVGQVNALPGQSDAEVQPVPVDVVMHPPMQGGKPASINVVDRLTKSDGGDTNEESVTPSSSPSLISLSDQDGD